MSFPTTMYTLKPLVYFQNTEVDITPTMYIMKNICSSNFRAFEGKEEGENSKRVPNILEQVNTLLKKPISEVEVLRKRQEGILTQLTYLKEQMLELRDELSKKSSSPLPLAINKINVQHDQSVKTDTIHWDGVKDEIVVFASPEWPPYSLLAVNELWPGVLRLKVSCHTHSSVASLPPHVAAFSSLGLTSQPNLSIRLIWKTMGSDCEIIFSPVSHSPIRGEVNLLRYLHRAISPACDLISEIKQENILDLCHRLRHVQAQAVQDKQLLLELVSARLGKSSWLGGDSMTVADVAAWSTVRSLGDCQLSQNMKQWQSRCSAVARG